MPLHVGSRIAHYDFTALIGEGGMGQVYQATDTKLNRQVGSVSQGCGITHHEGEENSARFTAGARSGPTQPIR